MEDQSHDFLSKASTKRDKNMKRKCQKVKQTKELSVSCVPSTATSLSKMNAAESLQRSEKPVNVKLKVKRIKLDERNKETKVLTFTTTDRKSNNADTKEKTEVKAWVPKRKLISIIESNDGVNNEPKASCSTAADTSNVTTEVNTAETNVGKSQKTITKRKCQKVKQSEAFYVVLSSVSNMNAEVESRMGHKVVPKLKIKRIKIDERNDEVNKETKASSSTTTDTKACNANNEHATEEKSRTSDICKTCRNNDGQPSNKSPEKRREDIKRCVRLLEHSQSCNDLNCLLTGCPKMKRVVAHTKMCLKKNTKKSCIICKQLIALCCHHAKHCVELTCHVPFCWKIKYKLQIMSLQEERQMRQRKLQIKRRHGSFF